MRVAFAGSSGTGKTTLATWLAAECGLPINPIGSRSIAKEMGFDSPYDVDVAGRRAEFQSRLLVAKMAWEAQYDGFVTDRTTCDNLLYTALHDVHSINAATLAAAILGAQRYTHVFYLPFDMHCKVGGDAARVNDKTYQEVYDVMIEALIRKYVSPDRVFKLDVGDLDTRKRMVLDARGSIR